MVECLDLPENPRGDVIYKLLPKNPEEVYYNERTDRNIGWITREEQNEIIRKSVIGIAGCGGMGGTLAQIFLRLGIGEIRISDCELFDASNINRQFAATRLTLGKSKAFETAKMLRQISDDTTIVVYPQGISEAMVDHFVEGCDVLCDEIEFWAIAARILLHKRARVGHVSLFCCDTIGFGTRLFFFTPASVTIEDCLGFTYEEAVALQKRVQTRTGTSEDIRQILENSWRGLLPEFPEYCPNEPTFRNVEISRERLFNEGRVKFRHYGT